MPRAAAVPQVGGGGFQDQREVVGPQAAGVDRPAGCLTGLGQGVQKPRPVLVGAENGLAAVAAVAHLITRAGIFAWRSLRARLKRYARAGGASTPSAIVRD
jgi:hypothetical protein